ncbi:unnamed protein product [Cuscuta epithymum]|uniref:Uncharacterized protein n=1 Tax=Cuscuta epithymum TaxID=186058 RepID=A0AAV0CZS2_9ASTE|nr:unnamed protein product [Cuscuta epithymum]
MKQKLRCAPVVSLSLKGSHVLTYYRSLTL